MITRTVTYSDETNEKLKVLAAASKRSVSAEIQVALERHTEEVTLPLAAAAAPKRKRAA